MEEDNFLASKIDFEEMENKEDVEKNKIRERNNYYQYLISKYSPPVALNASCLRKINSKETFEKQILNKGTHLSTLIPEYKITREFVFSLLKNYQYFDLSEEESKFLLQKYFSDALTSNNEEFEEIINLNENKIYEENNKSEAESLDSSEDEEENECEIECEEEINKVNIPYSLPTSKNNSINSNKKDYSENEKKESEKNNINKKDKKDNENKDIQSTMHFSSIPSMPTENFTYKKKKLLVKNNMNIEKIEETKEIKKNISLFLKNALEKRSGIDKKTTIIQFLYKNNFKGHFNASFFDIRDEHGELIFDDEIIHEWYTAIEKIEEKQKAAFECSQLLITVLLYGVEWVAKKMDIYELTTICSEVRDPSNLPKHLESTKQSLSNIIDNNIPNNFVIDLLFFIGNVYIKNKAGISPL